MYPIEMIDWWATLLVVLTLLGLTLWVWWKDGQPAPVGLMALPISFMTAWTWFGNLSEGTAWTVVIVTAILFLIGMVRPEGKDTAWHFGAMAVAVLGKAVIQTVPLLLRLLNGETQVTVRGWYVFFILVILVIIAFLAVFRQRIRDWVRTKFHRNTPAPNGAT